ncbi:BTAD domain-containing putative transcriptional regulator [Ammoniphilus sp. YIM 78166]|uniref:BTAD domain-containing putative transcriptional regulator n=1 Tax=Ammoniphilus sp. YIM 78166 TaxID=1644106 RepID=UPI00106FC6CB|nr:BTAD domain-containing putative transcriptional regulator [Ammoniphilus sp. YIM 78166]
MNWRSPVLMSKLTPPLVKSNILRRVDLEKKLRMIPDYSLTFLYSGPGYGKSTALSVFAREAKLPVCWYSISEHDDDMFPFLTHFLHSVRTRFPSFGEELLQQLNEGDWFFNYDEIHYFSRMILNELFTLSPEPFVIILDDFHYLSHSHLVNEWMKLFIQNLPPHVHLVLSSRIKPDWDFLYSMKLKDMILELSQKDLSFQQDEIEVLFLDQFEIELPPAEVELLFQKTEGWAISLNMIWQKLREGEDLSFLLKNHSKMEDLFHFMALEVLSKQTPEIQSFLVRTSILTELNGEICQFLLNIPNSNKILQELIQRNVFISYLGAGEYRYHALFREFLQQQLQKKFDQFDWLHRKAAHFYKLKSLYNQALYHYRTIQAYSDMGEVLAQFGETKVQNGEFESLAELLKVIPLEVMDQYFSLWFYKGEMNRYRCNYQEAIASYQRSSQCAQDKGETIGQVRGLEGQAKVYLDTIQPGKADHLLREALQLLGDTTSEQKVRVLHLLAENLINKGCPEEAEQSFKEIERLHRSLEDGELQARFYLRTGQLGTCKRILERKLENEASSHKHLSKSHRETSLLLSIVTSFLGEAEEAKRYAERGLLQGTEAKSPFVEAVGWMRLGHASLIHTTPYPVETIQQCYNNALALMEDVQISRGKAEPLMGLCLLHGLEGNLELALKYGEAAFKESEAAEDHWFSTLVMLGMGVAYITAEQWDKGKEMLNQTFQRFVEVGDSFGCTASLLWLSYIDYSTEDWAGFTLSVQQFLERMQAGDYHFLLQRRTLFSPKDIQKVAPMLLEAQKRKVKTNYVHHLLQEMGLDKISTHPGYTLRIETLGQFRVWLGEKEIDDKGWQRDKAKQLFQLLITRRKHLLPKEEIYHLLWGEADEEVAGRDFKVALNALNKALEPQRKARTNPFYIQRNGSSYGMNLASGYKLDAEEFEVLVQKGMDHPARGKEYLRKAVSLYKGDYLPEARYEDWSIEEKERLRVLYLRAAEQLAQLFIQDGEYDEAIACCERMIQTDPCAEEAYRYIMQSYVMKNNRSMALKYYQKCLDKLQQELAIKPSLATQQLYEEIIA